MKVFRTLLASLCVISSVASAQLAQTGAGQGTPAAASCTFSRIDFTAGALGAASLTRASSATYINVSGVLTTATTNTARFNYDANYPGGNALPSLTGPFLLVEPGSTNVFLQSNAFLTSPWPVNTSLTMTAGSFTSPDGTANGWLATATSGFQILGQATTYSNVPYAISLWAKFITNTPAINFQLNGVGGANRTISTTIRRVASIITPPAGPQTSVVFEQAVGANGFFGFQLETAAATGYFATNPSSYIVTTTGTVTRSAEAVTFTQPAACGQNTYTFDDGSTQTVSQAPGVATVPTNLNRPNIKFIDGSA